MTQVRLRLITMKFRSRLTWVVNSGLIVVITGLGLDWLDDVEDFDDRER